MPNRGHQRRLDTEDQRGQAKKHRYTKETRDEQDVDTFWAKRTFNATVAGVVVAVAGVVVAVVFGAIPLLEPHPAPPGPKHRPLHKPSPKAPPSTSSPAPSPPTKVEFIVAGSAPDGVNITYGPSGTNLAGPSVLDGTAKMIVPFDPSAEYYAVTAQLQGDGDITCKLVVMGPGDQPLTASSGAASGGFNICRAQARPENKGLNWENEG